MQLQIIVLPVIIFCMMAPPVFFLQPGNCVSMAFAQELTLQENTNNLKYAKLSPKLQQNIIEKNDRIRKLQEGIIDHKIKILGSKKKERSLLGDLEKIEEELQAQKKSLITLRSESEKQELLLADKQKYLHQVLTEKKAHQIHVKNRLASYYRMGSVGLMNVLFSSESLPELLEFKEYFSIMVQQDHTIIQQYLAQIKESNRAREEHAREKLRLMIMADELLEKETMLNQIHQEKNILLKQVNTEQHLYEQAISEIEEAAADLAATLQKIQTAAQEKPVAVKPKPVAAKPEPVAAKPEPGATKPEPGATQAEPGATQAEPDVIKAEIKLPKTPVSQDGFPDQKGLLEPPVSGSVITLFGQKIEGKFNSSTVSSGIDIRVNKGMEITAIYDGKIIHSGYLRGYGNLMIIDHGQQYFSLLSRAADFYSKEGTRITKGEVIGITGDEDPLYGEGLHLEIRLGSKAEDPLLWLKKNALPQAVLIPSK